MVARASTSLLYRFPWRWPARSALTARQGGFASRTLAWSGMRAMGSTRGRSDAHRPAWRLCADRPGYFHALSGSALQNRSIRMPTRIHYNAHTPVVFAAVNMSWNLRWSAAVSQLRAHAFDASAAEDPRRGDPVVTPADIERAASVVAALSRVPHVPTPALASAIASALALACDRPDRVIVRLGVRVDACASRPVCEGVWAKDAPPTSRSLGSTVGFQRWPRIAADHAGTIRLSDWDGHWDMGALHLDDSGCVVSAAWIGGVGTAAAIHDAVLGCVMPRAAEVVCSAFPRGLSDRHMLTAQELQAVLGLTRGLSRRDIAHANGKSTNSVNDRIKAVYRKLGVCSQGELFRRLVHLDLDAISTKSLAKPRGMSLAHECVDQASPPASP